MKLSPLVWAHGYDAVPVLKVGRVRCSWLSKVERVEIVNEMWDSGVCRGAGFRDPDGNATLVHHRYKPCEQT
jgi:hypothetical protein